jgi:hypothetical protein
MLSFHHASRRDRPSTDTARVTTRKISFKPTSRRASHASQNQDLAARHRSRNRADGVPQSICPVGAGFRHLHHLRRILTGYEAHHNQHRPHRSLNGAAPLKPLPEPVDLDLYRIRKQAHVGGPIKEYRLAA